MLLINLLCPMAGVALAMQHIMPTAPTSRDMSTLMTQARLSPRDWAPEVTPSPAVNNLGVPARSHMFSHKFKKVTVPYTTSTEPAQVIEKGRPVAYSIKSRTTVYWDEVSPTDPVLASRCSKLTFETAIADGTYTEQEYRRFSYVQEHNMRHKFFRFWKAMKPTWKNVKAAIHGDVVEPIDINDADRCRAYGLEGKTSTFTPKGGKGVSYTSIDHLTSGPAPLLLAAKTHPITDPAEISAFAAIMAVPSEISELWTLPVAIPSEFAQASKDASIDALLWGTKPGTVARAKPTGLPTPTKTVTESDS